MEEFSTQPPFVMNTRSFSVRSMASLLAVSDDVDALGQLVLEV